MPVTPKDRPLDALRQQTVDQLIMNYGHGHLSRTAFERRLDEAIETKSHERLLELTNDLALSADRQYTEKKKAEFGIRVDPSAAAHVEDSEDVISIFAGNTRKGVWDVPRVIRVITIFGGAELDFTDARFTAATTYISVFCLFGGINVRVRDGMRTLSKAVCIFGGVDNRGGTTLDSNAPLLVVEGVALFGGVNIRVKKTPRERLYEFANQLRTLFDAPPRA